MTIIDVSPGSSVVFASSSSTDTPTAGGNLPQLASAMVVDPNWNADCKSLIGFESTPIGGSMYSNAIDVSRITFNPTEIDLKLKHAPQNVVWVKLRFVS